MHQKTLRAACDISGIGLHSGKEARLRILPAPANHGVVFRTRKLLRWVDIPARTPYVTRTTLSTSLGYAGSEVCTVEHLMAALAGLEIDNAIIELAGTEIPVMDGSAMPFVERLRAVGVKVLPALRSYLRILQPIAVTDEDRSAGLVPADRSIFTFTIDYPHPAIGHQQLSLELTPQTFVEEVAASRTFGFEEELQALQANGLARGAGLDNAVGLGRDGAILNPEGLRFPDEFVRHKILDAMGDLYLAGMPLLGEYRGVKSGHALHLKLLQALVRHHDCWDVVTLPALQKAAAV
ncbi:MAG: UDP-3-O-acyl-N-acetylglucosamine deacetylase [Candidatus Lambdaproteobacteria bacterium]|nr:UDP-3-O-acyl-N-acetylglucosamine deacetylase [Candidatus Lambdaproteobacteria bacterium]